MKKKRIITLILTAILLMSAVSVPTSATNVVTPRLNNTLVTTANFVIDDADAMGNITTSYIGISGVTTSATINVRLQKKTLVLFWTELYEWNHPCTGSSGSFNLGVRLEETGTYRILVTFTVYGTGGEPDVIEGEATDKYS